MKKMFVLIFALATTFAFAKPQKVIFDTDMGNDIDDGLALAMLYDYHLSGKGDLLAILSNKDNPFSVIYLSVLNEYYGVNCPIGAVKNGMTKPEGRFTGYVSKMTNADGSYKFPRKIDEKSQVIDAVKLARKVLAESGDGEVVYISVGFSTNVARLLESPADEYSSLSGRELVAKKVKYFSIMAAQFATVEKAPKFRPEYNVFNDVPAAKKFFEISPVPIIFSGFEIGVSLPYPQVALDKYMSEKNPIRLAYENYVYYVNRMKSRRHDRPTWDLTSVLYVFSPELWELSEPVKVEVDEKGLVSFATDMSSKCRYLKIPQNGKQKIIDELVARSILKPKAEK